LYPAPLRDLLIELAAMGLFRAKWTERIHDEWIDALLRSREDLKRSDLDRTRELMNEHVKDCLVWNYEALIPSISCPDENDRHVIAAAIKGGCSAIVTFNLKHFPAQVLQNYDMEALHPDEFVHINSAWIGRSS